MKDSATSKTDVSSKPVIEKDAKGHLSIRLDLNEHALMGRFLLGQIIGKGAFGEVFAGWDIKTNRRVAIKIEDKSKARRNHLICEAKCYEAIKGHEGLPEMILYGEISTHWVLVMEYLGPSVKQLHELCNKDLGLETTLQIIL